jgi:hypothetical protein
MAVSAASSAQDKNIGVSNNNFDTIHKVARATGVDVTNTGVLTLFTMPTFPSKLFVVTDIVLRMTTKASYAGGPTIQIYYNGSEFGSDSLALTLVATNGQAISLNSTANGLVWPTMSSGDTLGIDITVGATSGSGILCSFDVFGYYITNGE